MRGLMRYVVCKEKKKKGKKIYIICLLWFSYFMFHIYVSYFMFHILCFMFHVSCFMFYVLCFMFYVLCFMFYVLCFMFYVLCFMFYVLCFMFYNFVFTYSSADGGHGGAGGSLWIQTFNVTVDGYVHAYGNSVPQGKKEHVFRAVRMRKQSAEQNDIENENS